MYNEDVIEDAKCNLFLNKMSKEKFDFHSVHKPQLKSLNNSVTNSNPIFRY